MGDRVRAVLEQAGAGRGVTLLVVGPGGIGKSAVLDLAEVLARRQGWKVARGGASSVEGPWPYAPVLEALSALCRRHPALLDGLGDDYRAEIERALAGQDLGWTGENSHQRLFVAAAELMRVAAAGPGLLLVVDDLHDADEASLRLLHYLARCAVDERVVLVLAHREPAPALVHDITASMVARGGGHLRRAASRWAPGRHNGCCSTGSPSSTEDAVEEVTQTGGGLPFAMIEMARSRASGSTTVSAALPAGCAADVPAGRAAGPVLRHRRAAGRGGCIRGRDLRPARARRGCPRGRTRRGRLPLPAPPRHERDWCSSWPRTSGPREHQRVAEALATLDRPPGRVAHHYLAAGLASRAVPYVVQAVEIAGALGAYRDALALVDGVREHAGPEHRPILLARRGDLLMALGDPGAVAAYAEAVRVTTGTLHRLVRARLARAAAVAGDLATARSALTGLELQDDEADASLLLARGMVAYFAGDMETARQGRDGGS